MRHRFFGRRDVFARLFSLGYDRFFGHRDIFACGRVIHQNHVDKEQNGDHEENIMELLMF